MTTQYKLFSSITFVLSLTASAAFADQPCGNYGISTSQEPCSSYTQQQPQPYAQVVYTQPAPTPCNQPQQTYATPPQQAYRPQPRYYNNYSRTTYGYQRQQYGYQQQGWTPRYQARRAEAPARSDNGLEVGARVIQDSANFEVGAGLYLRAHQKGGMQRLALEISADATESALLTQGAVMAYWNPTGTFKPFVLVGGGLEANFGSPTAQAGVGLDIDLGPRLTITGDVRAIENLSVNQNVALGARGSQIGGAPSEFLFGNLGISRKF